MKIKFLVLSTIALVVFVVSAVAEPVTLRVQTPYAAEQPTGKLLADWVDDVRVMSGGEINIELSYSSSVVQQMKPLMRPLAE